MCFTLNYFEIQVEGRFYASGSFERNYGSYCPATDKFGSKHFRKYAIKDEFFFGIVCT
jgi:hypothetical protein